MLTDKALQDFKAASELPIFFDTMPQILQYAYIIEWLDSVGVIISISHVVFNEWVWDVNETHVGTSKTRAEATEAAILTANEVHNAR